MLRISACSNYGELQEASGERWCWHQTCNILKVLLLYLLFPPHPNLQKQVDLVLYLPVCPLIQASEQPPTDTMTVSTKALWRKREGEREARVTQLLLQPRASCGLFIPCLGLAALNSAQRVSPWQL